MDKVLAISSGAVNERDGCTFEGAVSDHDDAAVAGLTLPYNKGPIEGVNTKPF
ncbi:hypothetical protein [Nocardia aurantia]|uniref:Uncharacterized protein n=1 Tax=Nocardia aurantia TaxID=2585199 RepID=A0A7K0DPB8_9NOCA|nr:hypothetical protein [Nocardia aurantia]MQY27232.1 hypothetical protein [Nocardia aurantia]